MSENKPDRERLEKLAKQIRDDQAKTNPAEKRVKVNTSFKKAVKRMGQTSPPKKKTR